MNKLLCVSILLTVFLVFGCNSDRNNNSSDSFTDLTAAEFKAGIDNMDVIVLDVRTEGEYEQFHIEDSMLIPVQVLEEELYKLEEYKDKDIYVYCRSGNRSVTASNILVDNGFSKVFNLESGISGWISAGFPIVE